MVSILFADLVGFTARSDRADPEDIRGTLVPFHRIAKEEIERHGGTLDKFIGDAAMGVFGVPAIHEDDPHRAIRAALAIQRRVGELGRTDPERAFEVRAAVETGEAVVTLATGPQIGENVVGDVVNTASRLQSVAPSGGVVVGEGAHHRVESAIDASVMEAVAVKGKAEPLRVWRVHAVRAASAVEAGPFVGRDGELRALEAAWASVGQTGSGRGAVVLGEAGIGKSRLVAEFRVRIGGNGHPLWLQGACPPYGEAATFLAFREVVLGALGLGEDAEAEEVGSALDGMVGRIEGDTVDRSWLRSRLAPLVVPGGDGPAEADREELFGACERFLRGLAGSGPMVLVLEDLHFAEPAMNALALHLTRALAGTPVLVVCTAREELFDRHDEWRDATSRPDGTALIRVARLSEEEVGELLGGVAGRVPDDDRAALTSRAGGNPLFARELARMFEETGGRSVRDAVPDTVQAVVAARIDLLPPAGRRLLQAAAVIGDTFWPDAVRVVSGEDAAGIESAFGSLVSRGLIREQPSSLPGRREFSCTHAVIRDVAYGQIPRRRRADRHLAAARWLEEALGERSVERAEALAHHYSVAIDFTTAAGDAPDAAAVASAVRFLTMAGNRSGQLDAGRATGYFLRALELVSPTDPGRAPLLVAGARYGRRSGRIPSDDVVRMLEEAAALFLQENDRAGAGEANLRLSMQLGARGQGDRARETLHEAVRLLEGTPGAGAELSLAHAALGEDASLSGRVEEALEWSERALAGAPTDEARIMALQIRGDARCALGDLDGVADLRESVAMAEREGLAMDAAVAHSWLAEWRWLLEGPAAGNDEELLGVHLADRRGLTGAAMWSRAARLGMLFDLGRWDELLTLGHRLLAEDLAAGGTQITGLVHAARIPVLVYRGRVGEALERRDATLADARDAQDLQFLLPALAAAAAASAAAADRTAAIELAGEFRAAARGRRTVYREIYGPPVVRAAIAAGNTRLAAELAADLGGTSLRQEAAAATGRGLVLAAERRFEEALRAFDGAEGRWRDQGVVIERDLAGMDAARCLAALGRPQEARERASAAGASLRSMGVVNVADPVESAG